MDRKRKKMGMILIIILLAAVLAAILIYRLVFAGVSTTSYQATDEVLYNPMMGFAPDADYIDAVGDNTLVYVDVTWKELEPEEGVYDFESINADNNLDKWREEGKKVVFRFLCDVPGDGEHMDIPDWLYEETKDGTFYDDDYGKGYSPDYDNETFIACHEQAIKALGEEYGQDSFFCFIELGSMGHWGEWHVKYDEGISRIPSEEICAKYVEPYLEAFPNAKILMRRSFSFVSEDGLGVYNDMTGMEEDTNEWLDWIKNGGIYDEPDEPMELIACPNIWETSPVGGEFTSSLTMEDMLVTNLDRTISLLEDSHMTFIGPKCPIANEEQVQYPEQVDEVLCNLGYRYGVKKMKLKYYKAEKIATIDLDIINRGVAPMYFDWPVYVYCLDENNQVIAKQQLDIDLTMLTQGEDQWITTTLDLSELADEIPTIAIGIEDPDTGQPAVALDMQTDAVDFMYILKKQN